MSEQDVIHDSPAGWVAQHIRDYVETNGEKGHTWRGYPALLLTTRGRKSGLLRRTALIYGQDGDNIIIVASRGGHSKHPAWYLNLDANPEVEVQIGAEKFAAVARTAAPDEKPRLWALMTAVYPPYDSYQAKTRRDIPVVVLERKS
ncbi:MAG: nitroreductase family deazaflavin-dependent oxidoreductase [Anaerolineae bacterium]|nr:nitroreductase family deazaflavin-dependent oxidoreductase [Anaerolineae bacterium]